MDEVKGQEEHRRGNGKGEGNVPPSQLQPKMLHRPYPQFGVPIVASAQRSVCESGEQQSARTVAEKTMAVVRMW